MIRDTDVIVQGYRLESQRKGESAKTILGVYTTKDSKNRWENWDDMYPNIQPIPVKYVYRGFPEIFAKVMKNINNKPKAVKDE